MEHRPANHNRYFKTQQYKLKEVGAIEYLKNIF